MKSVVVYCGARSGDNPIYKEVAFQVGKHLAEKGIQVIYGGGNFGLMGRVADGALSVGGRVVGIIPNFLAKLEDAHKTLTEIHFVDTMHQRKAQMVSMSDGVIALPGGFGTLDELFEILTWSQLDIFNGPIGVLNTNGFYEHLVNHVAHMKTEGFLSDETFELLHVEDTVEKLVERMYTHYENKVVN